MTRTTSAPGQLRVSVVIPVKNDAAALRRCLQCLARQTVPAEEIIVVDNDSTDETATVARDGGARVVYCGDPGIPAAAARGYDAARGELILRLDADSVPTASWIETMCAVAASRPRIAAFSGGARFVDGPHALRRPLAALYLGAYFTVASTALGHPPLFGSNLAMRAIAWQDVRSRIHRHDTRLHDDFDLAFHLGDRFRVGYAPAATVGISMRPFTSARDFSRRLDRGFRSVLIHWPGDFPPVRWMRLLLRRALAQRSQSQREPRGGALRPVMRMPVDGRADEERAPWPAA